MYGLFLHTFILLSSFPYQRMKRVAKWLCFMDLVVLEKLSYLLNLLENITVTTEVQRSFLDRRLDQRTTEAMHC